MSQTATRKPKPKKSVKLVAKPRRELTEDVAGSKSPLKVDREKGIIYGVKILGKFSKNTHDEEGVAGTEYSPNAMKQACELYEGMTVRTNHPADRKNPGASRDVYESFGQLRNCRVESEGVFGDLHFLKAHDLAEAVCEDVERGLGVYGLSHNARAGRERVEGGRLIIEEIELVRSVDLVDKPATNRNLWESHDMSKKTTTLRELLEAAIPTLSKRRKAWAKNLLEDDDAPVMDAPVEAEPSADDAMSQAFSASCKAVIDQALAGEMDMGDALKKLKELLTTHDKLNSAAEPTDVPEADEGDDEEKKKDVEEEEETDDKEKMEALAEVKRMKAELQARDLCESEDVKPSKALLKALTSPGLTISEQKEIVGQFKGAAKPSKPGPRSVAHGRNVAESQESGKKLPAENAASEMAFLRRG